MTTENPKKPTDPGKPEEDPAPAVVADPTYDPRPPKPGNP